MMRYDLRNVAAVFVLATVIFLTTQDQMVSLQKKAQLQFNCNALMKGNVTDVAAATDSGAFVEANDNPQNDTKKFFIIHVGVPKTGTTAIQVDTHHHLASSLAQDGAIWVGKWTYTLSRKFSRFQRCMREMEASSSSNNSTTQQIGDECWRENMRWPKHPLMNKTTTQPTVSLVTSYEEYSYFNRNVRDMERFQEYFQNAHGYEILAIAGYRRYHEYVRSNILQTFKRKCLSEKDKPEALWPSQGGKACKSVWKASKKMIDSPEFRGDYWLNVDEVTEELRSLGMKVKVMNYHDSSYKAAITQNFYCGMLSNYTPHTCQDSLELKEQQQANNNSKHNAGSTMHIYDDIVLAAAQRGLINTTKITRRQARNDLMSHHTQILRKGFTDLPLVCPHKSALDKLLQKSLALEQKMSKDLYGTEAVDSSIEAQHVQEFKSNVYIKRLYCAADTDKLFVNVTSYTQFLKTELTRSEWGDPGIMAV